MIPLAVFQPAQMNQDDLQLSSYGQRFLAQGDSWFSFGALNLPKNSNLLFEMEFANHRCAINCSHPGATLGRMVNHIRSPHFNQLLQGNAWRPWDGLLLSCGGNDLIDALGDASITDPSKRLLLAPGERPAYPNSTSDFISSTGWAQFAIYLRACFEELVHMREARTANHNIPIFMHGYHYPTIRNAPAGLGRGPWLYKAATSLSIPPSYWQALVQKLFDDFAGLLQSIANAHSNVYFFNSASLVNNIVKAIPGSLGASNDWINEIHLDWRGYEKIARPWCTQIAAVLP